MDDVRKWRAVLQRDASYDGAFVYAVRSTGIYCCPSCPSRRPQRTQVAFYPLPEAAEQAGFRPCRRCQPDKAKLSDSKVERVRRACQILASEPYGRVSLATLAMQVGSSPFHLLRTFKQVMGITPRQYAEARRWQRARAQLRASNNVAEALYEAGYGSSSRLYERAMSHLGMTPAAYRKKGAHTRIGFTVVPSPLGKLLLAATERGVCRIGFTPDAVSAERLVRNEFPAAVVRRDNRRLRPWIKKALAYLKGWQPHLDLPLDIRATAFQRRVWEALQSIPCGCTRSYSEIACDLGQQAAARAVARACAANPVPLAIPCHRVVRKDGRLGGYRWGIRRKQALLAMERAFLVRSRPERST